MILEILWNKTNIIKQPLNRRITQLSLYFDTLLSLAPSLFLFFFYTYSLYYFAFIVPLFLLTFHFYFYLTFNYSLPFLLSPVQGFPILYLRRIIPEILVHILRNSYV